MVFKVIIGHLRGTSRCHGVVDGLIELIAKINEVIGYRSVVLYGVLFVDHREVL